MKIHFSKECDFKIFKKMDTRERIKHMENMTSIEKNSLGEGFVGLNAILIERSHVLTPISKNQKLLIDFIPLNNAFNTA